MIRKILITLVVIANSTVAFGQAKTLSLFDGATLNGWIQAQTTDASVSGDGRDFFDFEMFIKMILEKTDPVSTYINSILSDEIKAEIAAYTVERDRPIKIALCRELNAKVISTEIPLYDQERFRNVLLRRTTKTLLDQNPKGYDMMRLNKLLIEDAYPSVLHKIKTPEWIVNSRSGAMSSIGVSRGVIYTDQDFGGRYRIIFSIRHLGGNPDHHAGVLIFCQRPA